MLVGQVLFSNKLISSAVVADWVNPTRPKRGENPKQDINQSSATSLTGLEWTILIIITFMQVLKCVMFQNAY